MIELAGASIGAAGRGGYDRILRFLSPRPPYAQSWDGFTNEIFSIFFQEIRTPFNI